MNDSSSLETRSDITIFLWTIGVVLLLAGIGWYLVQMHAKQGTIVLPGGITYLGPSPSPSPLPTPQRTNSLSVDPNTPWGIHRGKTLPFSFSYPTSLSLGVFPNDPYDSVTILSSAKESRKDIFFRVEDLTLLGKEAYAGNPTAYAQIWWKDYAWKGVSSLSQTTTASGLTGVIVYYTPDNNTSPVPHAFLSVPNTPSKIIWVTGRFLPEWVFTKLVHSISWEETGTKR